VRSVTGVAGPSEFLTAADLRGRYPLLAHVDRQANPTASFSQADRRCRRRRPALRIAEGLLAFRRKQTKGSKKAA
jgi:hypothetical protein